MLKVKEFNKILLRLKKLKHLLQRNTAFIQNNVDSEKNTKVYSNKLLELKNTPNCILINCQNFLVPKQTGQLTP